MNRKRYYVQAFVLSDARQRNKTEEERERIIKITRSCKNIIISEKSSTSNL